MADNRSPEDQARDWMLHEFLQQKQREFYWRKEQDKQPKFKKKLYQKARVGPKKYANPSKKPKANLT